MTNPITSHANCQHASTKPERAKCRRQRAKFGDVLAQVFEEKAAATAPAFVSVAVTRETWRDFKETPVRIATQIDDETQSETATGVYITQWGKQWISYVIDGKTKRTAGNAYVRVTTVES